MTLKNKRIGVVCGGHSFERDVSLRSGKNVLESLQKQGYKATLVDPADGGRWYEGIDVAFLALHGANGEDGSIQALLKHFNIPYTGSGVDASLLSMNKLFSKELFHFYNFPTASSSALLSAISSLPEGFQYPVVLKPFNSGSSVDVFVVDTDAELEKAAQLLVSRYRYYLLERFVDGTEITVSVLETPALKALPILELRPKNRFYDYEAKYTPGLTEFIVPAEISDTVRDICQALAIDVFTKLNCKGVARVDMIIENDQPYVLEVNTIPGLTHTSDLPAQAKSMGLSFDELIVCILNSIHV